MPASFCGLYGLRPTHGRIPLDGVLLQAPTYDTVGWFARDAVTFARVAEVLLRSEIADARPRRLVIAADAFEVADEDVRDALRPAVDTVAGLIGAPAIERLAPGDLADWSMQQQVLQGREAWETARAWIDRVNPRLSFEVGERYIAGRSITDEEVEEAKPARRAIVDRMGGLLAAGTVICLPTTPFPAPPKDQKLSERQAPRSRIAVLTPIAGTIGAPQISLPVAEVDGMPVGLSLLGAPGTDESLIAIALEVEAALGLAASA